MSFCCGRVRCAGRKILVRMVLRRVLRSSEGVGWKVGMAPEFVSNGSWGVLV